MSSTATSPIRFRVDPANPGQFFACCGLLEMADRLWSEAEGWFDGNTFFIRAMRNTATLSMLLDAAKTIQLMQIETGPNDGENEEDEKSEDAEDHISSLLITAPVSVRLDWWSDRSLKTWAGSMNASMIFLAMCNAIDPAQDDPLNHGTVVFDAAVQDVASRPKRRARNPREPFYFDARRGANALSIDVGFSTDSLKKSQELTTVAYPVVESMCLVGLQRCRPRPTDKPRVFDYFVWNTPISVTVAPVAVSGLAESGSGFRFANAFRTDQKKHKAFNPATPLQRS